MTEILYDLHRKFYISQQSMENTPELLTPMRKRITSYKETSATSSNPMMTPLTRLVNTSRR